MVSNSVPKDYLFWSNRGPLNASKTDHSKEYLVLIDDLSELIGFTHLPVC